MASPRELPADVARVQGMRDFAAYLEIMADDFDTDRADCERQRREGKQFVDGRWSSMYVGDFLRTWAAWLQDGCLREGAPFKGDVDPLTWQSLALQIHVAHLYE
ncbi:hypothetical protein [Nonomuraea pusilla]|uniref:Uncharacterized protein n=1 Tax=Nonomuraea pusilla TaxID=46177 RepID=A0A1H8GBP4_9ACTN|nr:hypothetical protein [Nonomuraea pusilla]SEN41413.1 hypothetical protein SAMN05660976_07506 [Nonomuraea pusilla]